MNQNMGTDLSEEATRAVLEPLCTHIGMKARVDLSAHLNRKKQLKGFVVYADNVCERASEILFKGHTKSQAASERISIKQGISVSPQYILRDLDSMLDEQDEPDFRNRPSEHAYRLTHQIISSAYTHYLGDSPAPAIAADGDGGLVVEWKRENLIVRLVVSGEQDGKSYVYSRDPHRSLIERSISGFILAQQLSTIFAT
jgi:hypothetical protein